MLHESATLRQQTGACGAEHRLTNLSQRPSLSEHLSDLCDDSVYVLCTLKTASRGVWKHFWFEATTCLQEPRVPPCSSSRVLPLTSPEETQTPPTAVDEKTNKHYFHRKLKWCLCQRVFHWMSSVTFAAWCSPSEEEIKPPADSPFVFSMWICGLAAEQSVKMRNSAHVHAEMKITSIGWEKFVVLS